MKTLYETLNWMLTDEHLYDCARRSIAYNSEGKIDEALTVEKIVNMLKRKLEEVKGETASFAPLEKRYEEILTALHSLNRKVTDLYCEKKFIEERLWREKHDENIKN